MTYAVSTIAMATAAKSAQAPTLTRRADSRNIPSANAGTPAVHPANTNI